ncbi:hypothetical protein AM571_CH01549 [Rhizobium etli 8C-3]|uniref:Uncharacterized protein n=1 Tax=Rhizobium etli 8C-3 TaxID=538025 RepID=A0A1L5P2R0_RHIET|nr:hypothetical protein AM571_CH01549 [Rhizobium etli 8C-3]
MVTVRHLQDDGTFAAWNLAAKMSPAPRSVWSGRAFKWLGAQLDLSLGTVLDKMHLEPVLSRQ